MLHYCHKVVLILLSLSPPAVHTRHTVQCDTGETCEMWSTHKETGCKVLRQDPESTLPCAIPCHLEGCLPPIWIQEPMECPMFSCAMSNVTTTTPPPATTTTSAPPAPPQPETLSVVLGILSLVLNVVLAGVAIWYNRHCFTNLRDMLRRRGFQPLRDSEPGPDERRRHRFQRLRPSPDDEPPACLAFLTSAATSCICCRCQQTPDDDDNNDGGGRNIVRNMSNACATVGADRVEEGIEIAQDAREVGAEAAAAARNPQEEENKSQEPPKAKTLVNVSL